MNRVAFEYRAFDGMVVRALNVQMQRNDTVATVRVDQRITILALFVQFLSVEIILTTLANLTVKNSVCRQIDFQFDTIEHLLVVDKDRIVAINT